MRSAWLLLLAVGCATPPAVDWPPAPDAEFETIIVSVDSWHAVIGLPKGNQLEEWGYGERAWYMDKSQGSSGALRAMLHPTRIVFKVVMTRVPWADRTTDPPARKYEIRLTKNGYRRLTDYIQAGVGEKLESSGRTTWYAGVWDYHIGNNCNHWAAGALRCAGLPIAPSRCFTAGALIHQIESALKK